MSANDKWNAANRRAAGGYANLRRELEKTAWSAAPVARANPEGYSKSLQSVCAVLLTFETLETPESPNSASSSGEGVNRERFCVVIDVASWRGCALLSQQSASLKRWSRALVAVTEAQCKLKYGPEAVLSRKEPWGNQSLARALIKAISKDVFFLAPLLGSAFWPGSSRLLSNPDAFLDRETWEPSERRSLPLIHCPFVSLKPLSADQTREEIARLKTKLASVFGASALTEISGEAQRPSSLQWRARLEGRAIASELALPENHPAPQVEEPAAAPKAARPRL